MKQTRLAHFGRLVLALQALAAPLDRGDELREVDLERVEDLVRVVLRPEADLALAGAGVLDDVLRLALGLLGDLLLRGELGLALARFLHDPLGLALGLRQHLLALLDDPARLLDLLGDRRAHLVEDVVDLLLVHPDRPRHGDRLGVVDQIVQLVDEYEDVHGAPGFVSGRWLPATAPPPPRARGSRCRRRRWRSPSLRSRTRNCTAATPSGRPTPRRRPGGG